MWRTSCWYPSLCPCYLDSCLESQEISIILPPECLGLLPLSKLLWIPLNKTKYWRKTHVIWPTLAETLWSVLNFTVNLFPWLVILSGNSVPHFLRSSVLSVSITRQIYKTRLEAPSRVLLPSPINFNFIWINIPFSFHLNWASQLICTVHKYSFFLCCRFI